MVVPVPPLHPPARDNTVHGCTRGTRLGGREENTDLEVRLLQETKARAAFPLLSREALTAYAGPVTVSSTGLCVARQVHTEHSRDTDVLPLRNDRAAQVT